MPLATIHLDTGKRHLVDAEKGLHYYKLWKGIETGTKQQQAFAAHITRVSLPPSIQGEAEGYTSILPTHAKTQPRPPVSALQDMNTKLYHEGRLQGRNEALPTGDR